MPSTSPLANLTLSITSVARPQELARTLGMLRGFPAVQVILNGPNLDDYRSVIHEHRDSVRFIINRRNLGIAAAWNQGIVCSNTRFVILSSDDLGFPDRWVDPLVTLLSRPDPPLQISLSYPMSYACFCVDKRLMTLQGWFDHNFTRAYYEDEDWYLRWRERLRLHNDPVPSEEIVPHLRSVNRHPHTRAPWNAIPNTVYFNWKWRRMSRFDDQCLHSRELVPYKRRLREPRWPFLVKVADAYREGDFTARVWQYAKPWLSMRVLTAGSSNPAALRLWSALRAVRRTPE
jgi:glycosyltransferase involved in cell wall biosynthesis